MELAKTSIPCVAADPNWNEEAVEATRRFQEASAKLVDRSFWPLKIFATVNLFLWHLEAFAKSEDPVPLFIEAFDRATGLLKSALESGVCINNFPFTNSQEIKESEFEKTVSGTFSDIWVGLTDDIYFDQSYNFTNQRLKKNGIDAEELFAGKVVLDAGCGSGKFSAAIARLGASRVVAVDIGQKGLDCARKKAQKVPYGNRIEYREANLLDLPFDDASFDVVWSNGVIHHTLNYEKCIEEFARVLRKGGRLFLYVNGRFGLYELLVDTLRNAMKDVPRALCQHFLVLSGVNSGRMYWIMDYLYPPYEWKSKQEVEALLRKYGFDDLKQLTRGIATDQIEQVSVGLPYAEVKYGQAQLKYLATKK